MAHQTNFNSKSLLNLKFISNVKGYDPLQVDTTLDKVIEDYKAYEKAFNELKVYVAKLEQDIHTLTDANRELSVENAKAKRRMDEIGDDPNVTTNNMEYITRIRKLEAALYYKGVDPKTIK